MTLQLAQEVQVRTSVGGMGGWVGGMAQHGDKVRASHANIERKHARSERNPQDDPTVAETACTLEQVRCGPILKSS